VALASDPYVARWAGRTVYTRELAAAYRFTDLNATRPGQGIYSVDFLDGQALRANFIDAHLYHDALPAQRNFSNSDVSRSVIAKAEGVPGGVHHDPVLSLVAVGRLMRSHSATGCNDLGHGRVQVCD
jgi:hypothetical protein